MVVFFRFGVLFVYLVFFFFFGGGGGDVTLTIATWKPVITMQSLNS